MTNIIGFNVAWFGLVYWGNAFVPIALLMLAVHIVFFMTSYREFFFIVIVTVIGIYVDSLLQYFNFFIFSEDPHIPIWLMLLWASFATTLSHSLLFLRLSVWLQILAGLLAPLSYIAGHQFEAVSFGQPLITTYFVLSLIWASLFVLFFKLQWFFVSKEVSYD
jgi:hypothetical protein